MSQEKIIIYGTSWCPDCRRSKQFLGEHLIPYEWVDIEEDAQSMAYVEQVNNGNRSVPTIIFPDGTVMVEPSNPELAAKLNINLNTRAQRAFYDVIIIGGGPAGLTSAIYTSREGLSTLVIDRAGLGGQTAITQVLDNFPGFEMGISGEKFASQLAEQAHRFGTETVQGEEIVDIVREGQYLIVKSANQRQYIARSVLIATGSQYRNLNVPGEMELIGSRVHFCATCDGAFYKGKDVMVIGGGNSGFEEGLFLTNFAKSVTIVEFMPQVKASKILQDKVAETESMQVYTNHAVREFVVGDEGGLEKVLVEDRATSQIKEWTPDGVFVFIGLTPNTGFLPQTIKRDQWGFIQTDATLQTSVEGVFAAGDVRAGSTKQAVSAAGEGATAALMIRQYLDRIGESARANTAIEREDAIITG
ncbi:MAG: hypothetical protein OHK0046_49180 [Anaerolineae bacterium]